MLTNDAQSASLVQSRDWKRSTKTDVQVVSDYLAALRRELKVPEALPRTVTATPDGTHFALTLTVAGTGR